MENLSRRQVLAVAAATVTLPMLESALGTLKSAQAQAATAPATAPGWTATTLKPADVKENEFAAVTGQKVVLSRKDKKIHALSNVCTHNKCALTPKAGETTMVCRCHSSTFDLDGGVVKAPATKPLDVYAIRVSDKGVIEIDLSKPVAKDAANASISV